MERIEVLKTYKIFIGGQFPRTESGRYYPLKLKNNMTVNVSLSSRKDFRNAVIAYSNAVEFGHEKKEEIIKKINELKNLVTDVDYSYSVGM